MAEFGSTFLDRNCYDWPFASDLPAITFTRDKIHQNSHLTASEPSPGAGGIASPAINILCHKAEEHLLKVLHDKQINRICFGTCEPEWSLSIAEAMFLLQPQLSSAMPRLAPTIMNSIHSYILNMTKHGMEEERTNKQ